MTTKYKLSFDVIPLWAAPPVVKNRDAGLAPDFTSNKNTKLTEEKRWMRLGDNWRQRATTHTLF